MDYRVIWTEPALELLAEVMRYVAQFDPSAAERLGDRLVRHTDLLATFPLIGPIFSESSKGDRRQVVCGKYRIFYRVIETQKLVEILTIWHGARRPPVFEDDDAPRSR